MGNGVAVAVEVGMGVGDGSAVGDAMAIGVPAATVKVGLGVRVGERFEVLEPELQAASRTTLATPSTSRDCQCTKRALTNPLFVFMFVSRGSPCPEMYAIIAQYGRRPETPVSPLVQDPE